MKIQKTKSIKSSVDQIPEPHQETVRNYEKLALSVPNLKRTEELELLKICKNPESSEKEAGAAQEKIINAYLRTVIAVAKWYKNGNKLEMVDLIHSGIVGICNAIVAFDLAEYKKLGGLFAYFCYRGIRMEINTFYRENLRQVSVSDTTNHKLTQINKLYKTGRISQKMSRAQEIEIIRENLNMCGEKDEFKIDNLLSLFKSHVCLDAVPESWDGESDNSDFRDLVLRKCETKSPATLFEIQDRNSHLMEKLNELPPDERNLLLHRYGFGCEKSTFDELGSRYKIKPSLARNQIEKIQAKLKKKLSFCGKVENVSITGRPDFTKTFENLELESI